MDPTTISAGVEARSVDASCGIDWWGKAWKLLTRDALIWVVMAVLFMVIMIVLGFVPLLGSIAASVLLPVFVGSWMLAARKVQGGAALEVGDLFLGFKDQVKPLLVLGALFFAVSVVIALIGGALGMSAVMGLMMGGSRYTTGGTMAALGAGMLALLVMVVLGFLAAMAMWFAPALVVLRGIAPVDALKASFAANLKNIVPFLVYSVIGFVASIVASIPFGLGWLVLTPVMLLSLYVSYQDVFGA